MTLLLGGLALGLTHSPKQYFEILSEISEDLRGIRKSCIKRSIKNLYGLPEAVFLFLLSLISQLILV